MATNSTSGLSVCPAPFLAALSYDNNTGYTAGRFCADVGDVSCCLPCPKTDFLYPDNFNTVTTAIGWINVAALACALFLIISYAFLPIEKTHKHYLSICLAMAVALMQLGSVIPLAAEPNACANSITPNDMHSSNVCAASGFFLLLGGWAAIMWVFLRALSLHLQICWQRVLGNAYMFASLFTGWLLPIAMVGVALGVSGVSFRFGQTCHINHTDSLADFWIPLLIFAAATMVIQLITFGYCLRVYLASLADDSISTQNSGLPNYSSTLRSISPKQAFGRTWKVIELQWRGILIVMIIIADLVFFAVVFVSMDDMEADVLRDPTKATAWIECLVTSGGLKNACLPYAEQVTLREPIVMAVLVLLSCNGFWLLLLLGRLSMFAGWYDLVLRHNPRKGTEFVSVETFAAQRQYEMGVKERVTSSDSSFAFASPVAQPPADGTFPDPEHMSHNKLAATPTEYILPPRSFGTEARYHRPKASFSAPAPPSRGNSLRSGTAMTESAGRPLSSRRADPRAPYPYQFDPLSMNRV